MGAKGHHLGDHAQRLGLDTRQIPPNVAFFKALEKRRLHHRTGGRSLAFDLKAQVGAEGIDARKSKLLNFPRLQRADRRAGQASGDRKIFLGDMFAQPDGADDTAKFGQFHRVPHEPSSLHYPPGEWGCQIY